MPIKTFQDPEPTLNLTPMIDIVFLLIIFFMVGTEFTEMERQIELELPSVKHFGALTPPPKERVVNVYRDGTILMDREEFELQSLLDELKRLHEEYNEMTVLIRGDGDGRYGNVTSVLAACRDAGFERLGIAVRADTMQR